jgi:hypothetical protein
MMNRVGFVVRAMSKSAEFPKYKNQDTPNGYEMATYPPMEGNSLTTEQAIPYHNHKLSEGWNT